MTKITETQALILTSAAQYPGGNAAPPASLPPAPRGAVAQSMIKAGLLQVAEDDDAQHPGLAWKLDGEAAFLRITDAGRMAIAGEADPTPEDAQVAPLTAIDAVPTTEPADSAGAAQDAPTGLLGATNPRAADTAPTGRQDGAGVAASTDCPDAALTASTAPLARTAGLRDTARQVLAAWDDADGQRAGLTDAIERLRAAMPSRSGSGGWTHTTVARVMVRAAR